VVELVLLTVVVETVVTPAVAMVTSGCWVDSGVCG